MLHLIYKKQKKKSPKMYKKIKKKSYTILILYIERQRKEVILHVKKNIPYILMRNWEKVLLYIYTK